MRRVIPDAQKLLRVLARAVQKVSLFTIQMELYRQKHPVTRPLHPLLGLPLAPAFATSHPSQVGPW